MRKDMLKENLTRRRFLRKASWVSAVVVATARSATGAVVKAGAPKEPQVPLLPNAKDLASGGRPIKIFCCDLNFIAPKGDRVLMTPAMPQDWAFIDPAEYFAWHRDFGVNTFFLQGYSYCGYAFCSSYFSIGMDLCMSNIRFRLARSHQPKLCGDGTAGAGESLDGLALRAHHRVSASLSGGLDQLRLLQLRQI